MYCNATICEIQRLSCVAPISVPHTTMSDAEVKGYSIEKGTQFVANLTKFMKDPKSFPNPEAFFPERFVDCNCRDDASSMLKLKVLRQRQMNKNFCRTDSYKFVKFSFFALYAFTGYIYCKQHNTDFYFINV